MRELRLFVDKLLWRFYLRSSRPKNLSASSKDHPLYIHSIPSLSY